MNKDSILHFRLVFRIEFCQLYYGYENTLYIRLHADTEAPSGDCPIR